MTRPITPVGIAAAHLERAVERLDDADAELAASVRAAHDLIGGLEPYTARMTSPESPALRALAERTAATDWTDGPLIPEMLSGHVEGQFLRMLVHATGARRVLEVGMFTGYSALAMAEALPAGGALVACELDAGVAGFAQEAFAASLAGDRIEVRVAPAAETLAALSEEGQRFDLVFVDADKPGYAEYLDLVLDGDLLAEGGLVCVDNTLHEGEPWAGGERSTPGEAIARFNERLVADPRTEQVLVPLRDGVTLVRRAAR